VREPDGGRKLAFVLNERGGGGWSWPERFGLIALDSKFKQVSAGNPGCCMNMREPLVIPLPVPVPTIRHFSRQVRNGRSVRKPGRWSRTQKIQDRNCWQVDVSTNFGVRDLAIDADSPLVVSLDERVFVGQGDEHVLNMQLDSMKRSMPNSLPSPQQLYQPCSNCNPTCSGMKTKLAQN